MTPEGPTPEGDDFRFNMDLSGPDDAEEEETEDDGPPIENPIRRGLEIVEIDVKNLFSVKLISEKLTPFELKNILFEILDKLNSRIVVKTIDKMSGVG